MEDQPRTSQRGRFDVEEVSILLIGTEEEQNEALRLIDRHLRKPLVAQIRQLGLGLTIDDAIEVYQEVLLNVWQRAQEGRFDPDRPLLPFLFTVAKRRAIDRIRKTSSRRLSEGDLLDAISDSLADTKVGEAWKEAVAREDGARMAEIVRNTIAKLPQRQQQLASVVVDCFPDRLTMQQIQEKVFTTRGERLTLVAVKRALQEARKKIREQLVFAGYMERKRNG